VTAMVRQSVYSRLAGYEDTNDADRLRVDPAMRRVVGGRATEKTAASTSQVGRFETQVLTEPENLAQLKDLSGNWIDQVRRRKRMPEIVLDLDTRAGMTPCLVAVSPFLKANSGTVRSQTRFAVVPAIERRLERARTTQKRGITHNLAVSTVNRQPVRSEQIPSGKCRFKGSFQSPSWFPRRYTEIALDCAASLD